MDRIHEFIERKTQILARGVCSEMNEEIHLAEEKGERREGVYSKGSQKKQKNEDSDKHRRRQTSQSE